LALLSEPSLFDVVAVVTKPDSTSGRGRKHYESPVKKLAQEHDIPLFQPIKVKDCVHDIRTLKPDAGVLVSYGKIIPQIMLDVFEPTGIINVHPSRLPEFRGPSPIEATILSGQTSTAVSLMKLDAGMDTGQVFAQSSVRLSGQETKQELYDTLASVGASLVRELLPSIVSRKLQPTAQSTSGVSITSLLQKEDGLLNPLTDTAAVLERKIRAFQQFPKPRLSVGNNIVIITSSSVVQQVQPDELVIPCAENTLLKIETLVAPNGKHMTGAAYMRGYVS